MLTPIDENTAFMGVAGVRYCLGRGSYAPSVAMQWCTHHWQRLRDGTKFVILRDVIDWLADRHIWDEGGTRIEDYRGEWAAFALARIQHEGDEFGRRVVQAALHCRSKQQSPEVQPFLKWVVA